MPGINEVFDLVYRKPDMLDELIALREKVSEQWKISLTNDEAIILKFLSKESFWLIFENLPFDFSQTISLETIFAKAASSKDFLNILMKKKGEAIEFFGATINIHEKQLLNSVPSEQIELMVRTFIEGRKDWIPIFEKLSIQGIALWFSLINLGSTLKISNGFMSGGIRPEDKKILNKQPNDFLNHRIGVEFSGMEFSEIISLLPLEGKFKITFETPSFFNFNLKLLSKSFRCSIPEYFDEVSKELMTHSIKFSYHYDGILNHAFIKLENE